MELRKAVLVGACWLAAATLGVPGGAGAWASTGPTEAGPSQNELAEKYREWLDVVAYLIEDRERDAFESLSTDWQRERFIEAFWRRRDPEPVTPENEFRVEHMRRWAYVNDVFSRDTPLPGWRTDRGRVYLVNGPPFQIHPYPNTQQLWPLEVWEYRNTPRLGMPSFYQIIFFKPRVFNEWRLYSPAVDGPEGLVIASPADLDNINLQSLATKFPMVFSAAIQAAPGLGALGSETVIARTMSPPPPPRPFGSVSSSPGEAEAAFLGDAPVEFHMQSTGFVHPGLTGYAELAIELPAEITTFVQVEDQLVANYEVEFEIHTESAGTWRRPAEGLILRVPESDRDLVASLPIEFKKRIWLLPGAYRVRVLLREVASQRIGASEVEVVVPERQPLLVGPPELFYVTEDSSAGGGTGPIPWVRPELRRGQPVGSLVRVAGEDGQPLPETLEIDYRVLRGSEAVWTDSWRGRPALLRVIDGARAVVRSLHIEALDVGSYRLEARARFAPVEGEEVDLGIVGARSFEVVDEFLPLARLMPTDTGGLDLAAAHHQLGEQWLRRNDFAAAREHFERATRIEPRNPVYKVDAAKTLIFAGELEVAGFLLTEAVNRDPDNQEALATVGLLRLQTGEFQAAAEAYERALNVGPGTPAIYNGLAEAFLSLGQEGRALDALDRSLEINSEQQQVRELRARLAAKQAPR